MTILSAVRTMLKIRSWSNHRLVGSTRFKRNSTNDAQRKSQEQRNPLSRDVIELKQAALWHGGNIRIDQASEACRRRYGETTESISNLISIRRDQLIISSSSAVELLQLSGGTCREQSSTDASDSSMCGSNCASRLERASGSSRKISRRKGNFPVAPILVADIPRSHSFTASAAQLCLMTQDEIRERKLRGSTGDKKIDSARRIRNNRLRGAEEDTATRNPRRQ